MSDSKGRMPAVTVEMLQQNRLFQGVGVSTLELLLASITPEIAQTGDWIIREGENADFMFVVLTGELEVVSRGGGPTTDVRVALLGPGDWVGEMALLEVQTRSASVRALAPTDLLRLSAHDMQTLIKDRDMAFYASVMANIARELGRRLRVADRLIARGSAAMAKQYVLESMRPPQKT
jgi:CRP/FNR family transcriptional regulator, cyclic AMP receptor protein